MANEKKKALTDKGIQALKKPASKKWVRDGEGLVLCLTPAKSGAWRHWYYIYTSPETNKKTYKPLGSYPELTLGAARDVAALLRSDILKSVDPKEEERREMEAKVQADVEQKRKQEEEDRVTTVSKLIDEYLSKHAMLKKSSWKEDERILNKDVRPVWKDRKAKDITRQDVMQLLDGMQGRGAGITTNTFKIIRRMFTYAVKKEIVPSTPCYAFEKGEELPMTPSRERTLNTEEVKRLWTGLDKAGISSDIQRILKLILLTGQRSGEVASMHWSEIDGRWWEFTPKETKITKEIPRKQRVYLTDTVLALIGKGDGYVFKSFVKAEPLEDGSTPEPRHITERAISHAVRRNLLTYKPKKKADSKPSTAKKKPFIVPEDRKLDIKHFTPHDLRRTCATFISELGYSDAIVDAVLAHLKKGEIRTYNKNKYDIEKQKALEAWERKLDSIIHGSKTADVIPITRGVAA